MFEIRPILSALLRSRVALLLLGLQVALTLAIVSNALFIIRERAALMARPSGMNEADTFQLASIGFGAEFDLRRSIAEDLALLRGLPGVVAAAPINSLPMSGGGWSVGVSLRAEQKTATAYAGVYFSDEHGLDALGVRLIAGRNHRAEEIGERTRLQVGWPPGAIITRLLAEHLWPGQDPLGKRFWIDVGRDPLTVIGVIDRLQSPWVDAEELVEHTVLIPQVAGEGAFSRYVVRAEPGHRDAVMKVAEARFAELNPMRIVRDAKPVTSLRERAYADDRAMMVILGVVIASLLSITALGLVGMASFWVTQRTRQIGTRRALGATRGAILRHFLIENFVITSVGLAVGTLLAQGFNLWLMRSYDTAAMPWHYVPTGWLLLWLLGQLAVLGPARRAARVPPAMATRSV